MKSPIRREADLIRLGYRPLLLCGFILAIIPALSAAGNFPDKVGYGRFATGGEGGRVYTIMTLEDSGPGSFREAAMTPGRRIIRFGVSGHIELTSGGVNVLGDVTIDGEGVTFTRARLHMTGDNFIVRNLRSRPGNEYPGQDRTSRDGLSIGFANGGTVSTGIIDRCSFSWACDENISTWRSAESSGPPAVRDITLSRNIIAECLQDSGHIDEGSDEPAPHSMGMLIGNRSTRVTVFGNLFVSNDYRHPLVKSGQEIEVINNFVFNYGPEGMRFSGDNTTVIALNNVLVPGENSPLPESRSGIVVDNGTGSSVYLSGNHVWSEGGWKTDWYRGNGILADAPHFSGSGLDPMPWQAVESYVLANAGARRGDPPRLDDIDQYFADCVANRVSKADPPDTVSESHGYLEDHGPAPVWDSVPPSIYSQIPTIGLRVGGAAQLRVGIGGSFEPVNFQWYHNGTPITGATGPVYTIPSFLPGQAGAYQVKITAGGKELLGEPGVVYLQRTYDEWAEAAQIPVDERDPGQVSVRFGIPNIIAYAFHLTPDEIGPLWPVELGPMPSEYPGMRITIKRPPTTTDLDWQIFTSTDLETWSGPVPVTNPVVDNPDSLTFDEPVVENSIFVRPAVALQAKVHVFASEIIEDFEDNDLYSPFEWYSSFASTEGALVSFSIAPEMNPPAGLMALKIDYGYDGWQYAYFGAYNNPVELFGQNWTQIDASGLRVTLKGDLSNQLSSDTQFGIQLREGASYERWVRWVPAIFVNSDQWRTIDLLWDEFESSGGQDPDYQLDIPLIDQIRFYCINPAFETTVYISRIEILYPGD